MRVLGHIYTLNDAEVIEQALAALRRQTRPLDAIVMFDNASLHGNVADARRSQRAWRRAPRSAAIAVAATGLGKLFLN